MPLTDDYPDCVAFVCVEDVDGAKTPIGTAFLIAVPGEGRAVHTYAVTARHVVREGRRTWLRFRRMDCTPPTDEPVPGWEPHGTSDVAIAPCDVNRAPYLTSRIPLEHFADRSPATGWRAPVLSDDVWFIGLLAHVPTMHEHAIPMVRSGTLGAMYQPKVPIWDELHKETIEEPIAHLIDTHSVGGFSGSPVFLGIPDAQGGGRISLLGVLIGHFGGPLASGGSAGVAIVVPVHAIRQLLDLDAIVKDRAKKDAAAQERQDRIRDENAAVQDSVGEPAEPSEFERFEDLTRKLVHTPKPDRSS